MIGIRVDANEHIASGHVMRCLSIAHRLQEMGEKCIWFVADDYPKEIIEKNKFDVVVLNSDYTNPDGELKSLISYIKDMNIDRLLIDSYYVTEKYLHTLKEYVTLTYIDDMMSFAYPVHRVINYALYASSEAYDVLYAGKEKPEYMLGARYAPLRKEFEEKRIVINNSVKNVFVTSGGTDMYDVVLNLTNTVIEKYPDITFHIVSGMYNKNRDNLIRISKDADNVKVYENVTNMSEIMMKCDAAISAGGTTLLELCSVGLPTVAFTVADNQLPGVEAFVREKVMHNAGDARREGVELADNILSVLDEYINNYNTRVNANKNALKCVDGKGAVRIAEAMLNKHDNDVFLKMATIEDAHFLYELRNDELTRKNSINKEIIEYDKHLNWYLKKLQDKESYIYILTDGSSKIGQIRLDVDGEVAFISYAISPGFRGRGYGTKLLKLIEDKALEELDRITLVGIVLMENTLSQKVFVKSGYTGIDGDGNILRFEKSIQRKKD